MTAYQIIKAEVETRDTQTIFECLLQLATVKTPEENLVRAALLSVYEDRTSEAETDALMELLDMDASRTIAAA